MVGRSIGRRVAAGGLAAVLSLVGASRASAGDNAGFTPPAPSTPSGEAINDLYLLLGVISIVILVGVEGALIWFMVRARRKRHAASEFADGPQIHGNTRLELFWTAIPVVVIAAIAAVTFTRISTVEESGSEPELRIEVQGHQFYWEYIYENGVISVDELVLPVGASVQLDLTAPDVIHSWWVPALTGKRDAIPGQVRELRFTPLRTGTFGGRCGEFCGIQHTQMSIRVEVTTRAQFGRWLTSQEGRQRAQPAELGEQTYRAACAKCHGQDGEGDIGPPIKGNSLLINRSTLKRLLLEGQNSGNYETYMPPVGQGWPERQFDALVAFFENDFVATSAQAGTQ